MKTTIKKKTYQAIYRLLDRVSPLSYDCGTLCNAICCGCSDPLNSKPFEELEMGIYLLPGEERLFTKKENWLHWSIEDAEDYDFPESWFGKIYFINCNCAPSCPRKMRPLQCRFFPLSPHLDEHGTLHLILSDLSLPYECPLISQKMDLTPAFIQATYTVWKHLIRDPLIRDLVEYDSSFRKEKKLNFIL